MRAERHAAAVYRPPRIRVKKLAEMKNAMYIDEEVKQYERI